MAHNATKIWRNNFSGSRVGLHMMVPAIIDMMLYQSKTHGRNLLNEIVFVQKDYENTNSLIPVRQLRSIVEGTLRVIQQNPKLVESVHRMAEKYNTEYFQYARKVFGMNISKLNNKQFSLIFSRLNWFQRISHGYAISTTWFVDSDGEDFSHFLMDNVENIIRKAEAGLKYNMPQVFSILTTPTKKSLGMKEEIESLKIVAMIRKNKKAKKIFLQKDTSRIDKSLKYIAKQILKKILIHYRKWCWMPYTYIGPAYNLDYYLSVWSGLLRQNVTIDKRLHELENYTKTTKLQRNRLFKELHFDVPTKRLFDIAAEIVYLKGYRKDAIFFGCYVLEKIHKEIAQRLHLTLKQVRFMIDWEIVPALKRGYFSEKILNDRIKYCVYYQKGKKGYIYTGDKAKRFLSKIRKEKEVIKKVDYLKGTCACPGLVKGKVKVINAPEEMGKMNKGDVMVAHTTFPALVPAMRKAAAIITDDGGLTCHAAIVAREFKTPCVVGTKIATRVLKDGDIVQVNAGEGIIRKI